jgi:hypothetical protein
MAALPVKEGIELARWRVGFLHDAREVQRRQRRLRRGFQQHRIAAGKRGRDFVRHQIERKVEGRDGGDRPDGKPSDQGGTSLGGGVEIQRQPFAPDTFALFQGVGECADGPIHFGPGGSNRFGGLQRNQTRQFVALSLERFNYFFQDAGALVNRHPAGVPERPCGGGDGRFHIAGRSQPSHADNFAAERRPNLHGLSRGFPLSVNQEIEFAVHID